MTAFEEVIQPMSNKAVITAVTNQKGGTGKTTTCENLGIGLAMEGKKVLLVDCDPQASLTIALGNPRPDDLPITLSDLMAKVISDQPISHGEGILHHPEGVDLVPANIALAGTEVSLVTAMSRETNCFEAVPGGRPERLRFHPAGLHALPWDDDSQCPGCR